jgi:hypothetical protein
MVKSNVLKVFAAHGLVAIIPKQALVASLRSLLARIVEFAFRFPVPCNTTWISIRELRTADSRQVTRRRGPGHLSYVSNFVLLSSLQATAAGEPSDVSSLGLDAMVLVAWAV